jgi:hypothetical protein
MGPSTLNDERTPTLWALTRAKSPSAAGWSKASGAINGDYGDCFNWTETGRPKLYLDNQGIWSKMNRSAMFPLLDASPGGIRMIRPQFEKVVYS